MHYDPEIAPDPKLWLDLDEQERIRLAKKYHAAARIKVPNAEAHALFHAIVENQIAEGVEATWRTVERLRGEGLSRHDAVHAVGSVIAQFTYDAMHSGDVGSPEDAQRELNAKIEALSARQWRSRR
jgi:hypothetical protein